ncbi:MAG: hypothetical protein OEY81_01820 [Candidatus Bathyarchaeota archaeon]|nr:hypothetical protein [Candidatus Bathyarchaeota archaeon]
MTYRNVYFWRSVYPLLRAFAKRTKTPVNTLVNLAIQSFIGASDEEQLKVLAEIEALVREEQQLKRVSSVMLRSGSFLPKYADKLFRAPWDSERDKTSPFNYPRKGDVPLKALNPKEEVIMRRVLARREAIAQRIAELLGHVLPKEKFRLAPRRSGSRCRAQNKRKGGEKLGSDT